MQDTEKMAAHVEGQIQSALEAAMEKAIDRYEAEDVLALPDGFRESLGEVLSSVWLYATEQSGQMITEFRSDCFAHIETKADEQSLFERIRDMFVERYGAAKVARIFDTTRRQLLQLVLEGQQEGLPIDAIARRMREAVPQLARLRASTIARTETHAANRFANQAVARESRFPMVKKWAAITSDSRTRDFGEGDGVIDSHNHRAMDGVRLPLDVPYMVPTEFGTKEPLMFPGDPNGTAGNVINCRCAETYRRADRD